MNRQNHLSANKSEVGSLEFNGTFNNIPNAGVIYTASQKKNHHHLANTFAKC